MKTFQNENLDFMTVNDEKNSLELSENFSGRTNSKKTSLEQNYPNPFNPTTSIKYTVARAGQTTLKIFDLNGKEISTLADCYHPPGTYYTKFNGNNLSGGTYVCRLQTSDAILSRKMILEK